MARFTVSDCMLTITNRFDMTLAASIRARQIARGNQTLVEQEENDKCTVLALREIAGGSVNSSILAKVE